MYKVAAFFFLMLSSEFALALVATEYALAGSFSQTFGRALDKAATPEGAAVIGGIFLALYIFTRKS